MLGPVAIATASEARTGFRRSVIEGLNAVRGYPLAANIIPIGIAWGLIGGGYDVLIGLYGTRILWSIPPYWSNARRYTVWDDTSEPPRNRVGGC